MEEFYLSFTKYCLFNQISVLWSFYDFFGFFFLLVFFFFLLILLFHFYFFTSGSFSGPGCGGVEPQHVGVSPTFLELFPQIYLHLFLPSEFHTHRHTLVHIRDARPRLPGSYQGNILHYWCACAHVVSVRSSQTVPAESHWAEQQLRFLTYRQNINQKQSSKYQIWCFCKKGRHRLMDTSIFTASYSVCLSWREGIWNGNDWFFFKKNKYILCKSKMWLFNP